jgi:diguanylate cyclase (GGDEF)-like protein/PAS domain S-box-containing protein
MPPHILVVDDHNYIRNLLVRLLNGQGYQTRVAASGREALDLLLHQSFDLVLLDLMMPDMNGIEVLRQLRQQNLIYHTPVVVVSGVYDLDMVAQCIELGADDYLFKPFNDVLLRARVNASLERKMLRDREHTYLEQRLRALGSDIPDESTATTAPATVDIALLTALDALERSQRERRRIEAQLRALNATLEERVAERSAAAEQSATALRQQTLALQSILDSIGDAIVVIDNQGRLLQINPAANALFGDRVADLTPNAPAAAPMLLGVDSALCPPDDLPLAVALRGEALDGAEFLLASSDPAAERWLSVTARPLRDAGGDIGGAVAVFRDITTARQAAEALRASEERYALAAQAANDGLWDWNLRTGEIYFSQRWKATIGFQDHEIGNDPSEWFGRVHPDDREGLEVRLTAHLRRLISGFEHEYRILHRDTTYRWMSCRGIAVRNASGQAVRIVGSQTDINERKLAEQRLLFDALHDSLTGLANRSRFMDRLGHVIARTQRGASPSFAVLFLDLDRFKLINDSLGHLVGDQLLIAIARRLERCLRPGDTLARLGGDEFAVLLEDVSEPQAALTVAERILRLLEEPFHLGGHDVFSGASIGIALSTSARYHSPADVLRDADTAMYHAKVEGRSRYAVFHPSMHDRARRRLQIETDLRRGIERNEFFVVYQPIVELSTQQTVGFEALLRWRHPHRGIIGPTEFINVAEETGLIVAIGQVVLHEACRQLSEWRQRHPARKLTMHINLSPRQIADPHLVDYTAALLDTYNLDRDSLHLEITETAIIEHGDGASRALMHLRTLGAQICIDDFGTGYSSLSYLHRFPIGTIKIDRSFISQIHHSHENAEIVRTIIALAHSLGMTVIAEGAETEEQLTHLRSMSCPYGQGWLFAHALEPAAATALLDAG